MIKCNAFKKLMEENDDRLPLLTLDEFLKEIRRKIPLRQMTVTVDALPLRKYGN